ncbi:hypothetical protein LguiA_018580 [Lonicera macranthoides]
MVIQCMRVQLDESVKSRETDLGSRVDLRYIIINYGPFQAIDGQRNQEGGGQWLKSSPERRRRERIAMAGEIVGEGGRQ